MTPALARIKRGVRSAIAACGGIDGAAATAEKSRSLAGNWNNRDLPDTPVLADAFALDEAAMIAGHGTPILSALAGELGHVAIRLPDAELQDGAEIRAQVLAIAEELGDVSARLREGLADGRLDRAEAEGIDREFSELIAAAAKGREMVRLLAGASAKVTEISVRTEAGRAN